jgi:hypothetical protein
MLYFACILSEKGMHMQHKRKMSDIMEETDGGAFLYGSDDLNEVEDEPIAIQTGLSMPAWKTPSIVHEYASDAPAEQPVYSSNMAAVSQDAENGMGEFFDIEQPEESEYTYTAADARAAILKEKPIRISFWKRFTALAGRLLPSFADEAFLSRLNLYLGGLAFVIVLVIFVVVLF